MFRNRQPLFKQGLVFAIEQKRWRSVSAPNKACTRLGVRAAFFELFLACADSRFEGESTLPPQAGNAHRWAVSIRGKWSIIGLKMTLAQNRSDLCQQKKTKLC